MPDIKQSLGSFKENLAQGGMVTALGYMFYAAWDSMERSRYLAAYQGAGEVPILWSPAFLTVALLCALATLLVQKGVVTTVYLKPLRIVVPVVGSVSSIVLCLQRLADITPNPVLVATFGLCIAWYMLCLLYTSSTVNDPRRAKLCGGGFTFCSLDKRKIA